MSFTAKDVMTLREKSGAGMLDCKKALTDADGDMEKAAELLRERNCQGCQKGIENSCRRRCGRVYLPRMRRGRSA